MSIAVKYYVGVVSVQSNPRNMEYHVMRTLRTSAASSQELNVLKSAIQCCIFTYLPITPRMRPIARQSSRLANSNRIRHSSVTRLLPEQERRGFHTSVRLSSDTRPPNGPSDRHTPLSEWRQQQKEQEQQDESHEQQEYEESKPETEPRKAPTRRALRSRRSEVPKPPPIPDWFLRHNVKLVEERPGVDRDEIKWETIRCVDTETGHTLFSVERCVGENLSKHARESEAMLEEAFGKVEKLHPARHQQMMSRKLESVGSQIADTKRRLEQVLSMREQAIAEGNLENVDSKLIEKAKGALEKDFFDQKYDKAEITGSDASHHGTQDQTFTSMSEFKDESWFSTKEWHSDPLRWLFLEAEASARAAFSFADERHPTAWFATERVDLSLQCADPDSHEQMDEFVHDLANIVDADVIQLDANDLAELTEEYVGQGDDAPGAFSNLGYEVFDGYEATALTEKANAFRPRNDEDDENEFEDDEADEDDHHDVSPGLNLQKFLQNSSVGKLLGARVVGIGIGDSLPVPSGRRPTKSAISTSDNNRDDARLTALFDSLLNSTLQKQSADDRLKSGVEVQRSQPSPEDPIWWQKAQRMLRANAMTWFPDTAEIILAHLGSAVKGDDATKVPYRLERGTSTAKKDAADETPAQRQTIVYVRDLRDIHSSKIGENIIWRLSKVVNKRRRSGERIMVVGSTAQDVPGPIIESKDRDESFPFRALNIPPVFNSEAMDEYVLRKRSPGLDERNLEKPAYNRILEINVRHLQSMLRRMRPNDNIDLTQPSARKQLNLPSTHFLTERVLSLDQVQRLALVAVGLAQSHVKSEQVHPVHVALAASVAQRSDHVNAAWSDLNEKKQGRKWHSDGAAKTKGEEKPEAEESSARLERIKKSCNNHESRLFSGVVDAHKIKSGFSDVHAPHETINALKTLTSLSLLRPDAFKYGVLANDRLPGLLLYGPPGTGKTLLAKAVAKESKATVMEVSGAQIYEKYVGEGEKMVRAVFSLAKKLSPCVVFIDEADAIFGSRDNAGNRNTHREIINQFLREWDGMDDHGAFMMMATNRPFDLDDAVLRRLPRRLLVDLPVAKDRESILGIHLRDETLDPSISLAKLAGQTPFYSGSDLKNLCVAAALAAVRDENDLIASHKEDEDFKLPATRTLTLPHFEKALAEISASISEDMGSLTAIRKFDEQYGDRRGRKKKQGYGFSTSDGVVDEAAVMVRRGRGGEEAQPPAP